MYQYEFLSFDKYTIVMQDINVWGIDRVKAIQRLSVNLKLFHDIEFFLRNKKAANKKS